MKLLIVDDERHVREAIKLLIKWEDFLFDEILEASDGESAIALIKAVKPDIVLTDMLMPILGGVQLLEWIHNHAPNSKTVVISGYDDFNYVRQTIKYGGQDYILKPIDEAQLNEALHKAVKAREKDKQEQTIQQEHLIKLNVVKPLYWKKVFSTIIEQKSVSASVMQEIMTEFQLDEPIQSIRMVVLPIHSVYYRTINRFNKNIELLSYSLSNICNEFIHKENIGYAFHNWNQNHDIVILLWKNHEQIIQHLESINRGIEATFGHKCDFGVGSVEIFPYHLKTSLKSATTVLKKVNLAKVASRIHVVYDDELNYEKNLKFDKYQEHLRLALLSEQKFQVEQYISQWFNELQKATVITMEQLELWQQELHLFEQKIFEGEQSEISSPKFSIDGVHLYIPFDEKGYISLEKWKEQLLYLMNDYFSLLEKSNKQILISLEIADYIDKHYNQELSLQTIADCFLLSREYISRKFKQDMNENISDYITKVRINHAKQLLLNPQLKLVQISEMVGYADDKYFSKVFKKIEGISPNQYRKEKALS